MCHLIESFCLVCKLDLKRCKSSMPQKEKKSPVGQLNEENYRFFFWENKNHDKMSHLDVVLKSNLQCNSNLTEKSAKAKQSKVSINQKSKDYSE